MTYILPHLRKDILALEKTQRFYTKHIEGLMDLSYKDRLAVLNIYSLERRRERYLIIYIWKILENIVPNFSDPIGHYISERRGRYCITSHIELGRLGSLQFNSFRFKASRLFNYLPKFIRNSSCTVRAVSITFCLMALMILSRPTKATA